MEIVFCHNCKNYKNGYCGKEERNATDFCSRGIDKDRTFIDGVN